MKRGICLTLTILSIFLLLASIALAEDPPSADEVEAWLEGVGDALVNTRGPSYRQLSDDVKNQFTGQTRVQAIVDKPTLIKRPLMVNGDAMTVGFNPDQWTTIPNLLKA